MQISVWTFAIQAVNFLVLVWLLERFLYRPVLDVIARRRKQSQQEAKAAESLREEADALKHRYESALADIDRQRRAMLDEARAAAEAERAKLVAEAHNQAARVVGEARAEAGKEQASALVGLRQEITGMAVRIAGRLIADVAPAIPTDAMLTRLEQELAAMPAADRRRIDEEIAGRKAALIATARALTEEEQARWKRRLETALGRPLAIEFTEDRSLLAGAEMRLPHTIVHASWADLLERARCSISGAADAGAR